MPGVAISDTPLLQPKSSINIIKVNWYKCIVMQIDCYTLIRSYYCILNYNKFFVLIHRFVEVLADAPRFILSIHSRGFKKSEFVHEKPLNSFPVISRIIISASTVRGVNSTFKFLNCSSKFSANLGFVFRSHVQFIT